MEVEEMSRWWSLVLWVGGIGVYREMWCVFFEWCGLLDCLKLIYIERYIKE